MKHYTVRVKGILGVGPISRMHLLIDWLAFFCGTLLWYSHCCGSLHKVKLTYILKSHKLSDCHQ